MGVPLGLGRPYWADDPDFDLEFHLREIALPGSGTEDQLGEQVSRIHARRLDRTRPLWEMYLIHNVEGGRSAIYSKVHHAAIDGVSGAEDSRPRSWTSRQSPATWKRPTEPWAPAALPNGVEMFGKGVLQAVQQPADLARRLPKVLPHLADLPGVSNVPGIRTVSELAGAVARLTGRSETDEGAERRTLRAPGTPLNGSITAPPAVRVRLVAAG